ncbi:ActS/PrrB/RegB family redox-sensitive histidine kinase [Tistrella sp.]|uniref:ActS/PrrB/RegB family redox-sensitive histidine kinase n=1 Tax=Tistrella sp. TaxID=2024861 RepID=UPI000C8A2755|nr:ActS/PrrB/RegB family redox-sensitive histidine kinase [Tistrella sp.]MAD38051.1 two-component sensor histidine kinase [Tistrella sp.]
MSAAGPTLPPAGSLPPGMGSPDGGRVRAHTLVTIRWLAIAGQLAAIMLVSQGLRFPLPLLECVAAVGASALLNLATTLARPANARLTDGQAALFLAFDVCQLAVLLQLTGGLANPFSVLVLAPATISATILSVRSTVVLAGMSLIAVTMLAVWHHPLPWDGEGGPLALPPLYVAGVWAALVLSLLFLTVYAARVAAEARRMSDALSATQIALSREQQLSAVGALAAAAAHELGTPLGTIAIVARELERDLGPDGPQAEDLALLVSESARCREILARLARAPEQASPAFKRLGLPELLESAAAPYRRSSGPEIVIEIDPGSDRAQMPDAAPVPELLHGLGNLVENASQFAAGRVTLWLGWDPRYITIEVRDDGPGFPADLLPWIGEPYMSTRREAGRMGLGVFIAKTLLARTGADVRFANRPEGGAVVSLRWSRSALAGGGKGAARPVSF